MTKPARRIFIECTHTYIAGGNTGIRRVARNLANNSHAVSDEFTRVLPVVWGGIGFFTPRGPLTEKPHFVQRLKRVFDRVQDWIGKAYQVTPPPLRKPFTWLKAALFRRLKPDADKDFLYSLVGLAAFPIRFLFGTVVQFHPGDIVVLVDSTWNSKRMLKVLMRARLRDGIQFGVMIHDLFPLTMPETCQEETIAGYRQWFEIIAPEADFFVTNSEATRISLENYLGAHPDIRPYKCSAGSFLLGAELDLRVQARRSEESTLAIWNLPGFVLLAVGTIEPRKNHAVLLDAFDLLCQNDVPVSLLIVGRPGWKSDSLLARIATHPLLNSRLLHLDDASDTDLANAYERADCLICPSWAEGFGLPVVEGLIHGLPVIASDIPVFREVVGDSFDFFPPDSPPVLADLITVKVRAHQSGKSQKNQFKFEWITWEESTRNFVGRVIELADSRLVQPPLYSGS